MAEHATVEQQVRAQFEAAQTMAQHSFRAWNDVTQAAAKVTFDTAEQSLRYGQELRNQTGRVMYEALATYRQMYYDGLKSWQGYAQQASTIFPRR